MSLQRQPFDRDLIRQLIDGHVIFAGIIYLLSYGGIRDQQQIAYMVSIANAIFFLGYCALIYKMLPSIGMIGINLIALIWLISSYLV